MIPPFEPDTGNLPPGIHEASWDELVERFGYTEQRRGLLSGLRAAIESLRRAGCRRVYVDGSFVTAKQAPADFDACWEVTGVSVAQLDPVLLDFRESRQLQKAKFGGELFPAIWIANQRGTRFTDYFQLDSQTGERKGIVAIDPGGLQ